MKLTEELKSLLIETAKQLKGSARRLFQARTVKALDPGGASLAERELGWNRKTIRKGIHEVEKSCPHRDSSDRLRCPDLEPRGRQEATSSVRWHLRQYVE